MALLGKYLSFLWKSTSEHGVHSPFVYNLVTQCFYNSQKKPSKNYPKGISEKKGQFILRLLAYFNPKSIWGLRKDLGIGRTVLLLSYYYSLGLSCVLFSLRDKLAKLLKR